MSDQKEFKMLKNYDLNTSSSITSLSKILGIEFSKVKEFKEFILNSPLKSTEITNVIKNKKVVYNVYDIREVLEYSFNNIEGNHKKFISVDINLDN